MKRAKVIYAYKEHGTLVLLPKCKSLRALLLHTPHLATPGHIDERTGDFTPLSTAHEDFGR